jgi:hypothetical protein
MRSNARLLQTGPTGSPASPLEPHVLLSAALGRERAGEKHPSCVPCSGCAGVAAICVDWARSAHLSRKIVGISGVFDDRMGLLICGLGVRFPPAHHCPVSTYRIFSLGLTDRWLHGNCRRWRPIQQIGRACARHPATNTRRSGALIGFAPVHTWATTYLSMIAVSAAPSRTCGLPSQVDRTVRHRTDNGCTRLVVTGSCPPSPFRCPRPTPLAARTAEALTWTHSAPPSGRKTAST